jgi:hypothetical protein
MLTPIAVVALNTFVAERRFVGKRTIGTIFAVLNEEIEVAVFICLSGDIEVAIFIVSTIIAVLTVLAIHDIDPQLRDILHQRIELLKERFGKIIGTTVIHRIPLIAIPWRRSIRLVWLIQCKDRNVLFSGQVTLPFIERAVIAPAQSPAHAALGTECRWRNWACFPFEYWRNILIEPQIIICNLE